MKEGSQPRVLCVDDQEHLLRTIKASLQRQFDVTTASSGEEALETMASSKPFVVVLSDMRMPGMDGVTFLSKARGIAPDTVRMLFTGHADLEAALEVVNQSYVFRFLTKPCPPDQLVKAVEDAVEQYRLVTHDRVLLEEKLESMAGQLIHADRLATLGTLAHGVAHELGNVTATALSVASFIRELADEGKPAEPEMLDILDRVADHLRRHSQHLGKLGHPGNKEITIADLRTIVTDTLAMMRTSGRTKTVDVDTKFPTDIVQVEVDRTRIEQVLVNLVGNAADALDGFKRDRRQILLTMEVDNERQKVLTHVSDTGCGIPQDKLESVFEPYFTTKPQGKGTGLGLPVIKQILAEQKGSIAVRSEEGVGTTFTFELPLFVE